MRIFQYFIFFVFAGILASCAGTQERQEPKAPIVLVGPEGSPTNDFSAFEMLEEEVKENYPGHLVRWAFTDETVIEQVRKDRFIYFTKRADGREPDDVIGMLGREGYRRVLLQPLSMLPLEKMHSLRERSYGNVDVVFGEPVINSETDIDDVLQALDSNITPERTTIIVAPGDADYVPHENLLVNFADAMESAHQDTFVMSAEGEPGERRLREAQVHARESGRVHIIPFVLMPRRDAITHRIFRTQESWRELIASPKTTFGESMVYESDILDMLMEKIGESLRRSTNVQ